MSYSEQLGIASLDRAIDTFLAHGDMRYEACRRTTGLCLAGVVRPPASISLPCSLGWFYEQARELHIWHLDELVTRELGPAMLGLEEAIRGQFQ